MGFSSGQPGQLGALVTREVRWFFDGPLPTAVADWFSHSERHTYSERRVDRYDLDAAMRGVGLKHRDQGMRDSKFLLDSVDRVELAPGIEGCVEDWLKVSEPRSGDAVLLPDDIELTKDIITREYFLEDGSNGCEAELASVTSTSIQGWTICFETFGDHEMREEAFQSGVERFFTESPLPNGLELKSTTSLSYPNWIARRLGDANQVQANTA